MPKQVLRYACQCCGSEFKDFATAVSCEALPRDPILFPVGSSLSYENESGFGSMFSYTTRCDTVLHVRHARVKSKETGFYRHAVVYVVGQDGNREAEVFEGCDNFGTKQLISPIDSKFSVGYAQILAQEDMER
jgi:hypothetical protein